jgi:anti-sigma factor RsiW
MMNCEEFDRLGLDLDRADTDPAEAASAAAHARLCARCGALLESWRELKQDLRLLREATLAESAPARVEMRLKQELRTRREARVPRNATAIAAWALAAAAVLAAGAGLKQRRVGMRKGKTGEPVRESALPVVRSDVDSGMLLAADYDTGAFTRLPGSVPSPYENQEILRVRMQRGALGRFGLPVAQERASEWVQVDFLIGEDGQPQAVRLHEDSQEATLQ